MDSIPLTLGNVVFAFSGAAFIFLMAKFVITAVRMFKGGGEMPFEPNQRDDILDNCCRTFPMDSLEMNGGFFMRGDSVRIKTDNEAVIEGQFVGVNKAQMICIMTDKSVIAQSLGAIMEIQSLR
ncbi:MAG: hypothetical protein FWC73_08185 [Defluviitaleaceae bacterium]|nr:hypothetical protein [Defluviitaleaceae bacterium]